MQGKLEPEHIVGSVAEISGSSGFSEEDIPTEVLDHVRSKIAEIKKIDVQTLQCSTNLILDLHADSLDMAEFKSVIQSAYPTASNPPIGLIKTVGDLAALALGKLE